MDIFAKAETAKLQNLDAEQGLIGSLLSDPACFMKIDGQVSQDEFAEPVHGRIFAAFEKLWRDGRRPDVALLRPQFDSDGALDDLGGGDYLIQLNQAVVSSLNVASYAQEVTRCAQRRELVDATADIQRRATDPTLEPVTAITAIKSELSTIAARGNVDDIQGLDEIRSTLAQRDLSDCYPTGLSRLDTALMGGLYSSKLYGIAARPKGGKTAFMGPTLAYNLAEQGTKVAFIALESSAEEIGAKFAARRLGMNASDYLKEKKGGDQTT